MVASIFTAHVVNIDVVLLQVLCGVKILQLQQNHTNFSHLTAASDIT